MNKRIKYLHKNILLFRQSYRFLVEISFISQIQILKYPFRIDHILKIKEFLIGEGRGGYLVYRGHTEVDWFIFRAVNVLKDISISGDAFGEDDDNNDDPDLKLDVEEDDEDDQDDDLEEDVSDESALSDPDAEGDSEEEEKGKKARTGSRLKHCIAEQNEFQSRETLFLFTVKNTTKIAINISIYV